MSSKDLDAGMLDFADLMHAISASIKAASWATAASNVAWACQGWNGAGASVSPKP